MTIPTETIGSIPRPLKLIEAVAKTHNEDPARDSLYDEAIRDTVAKFMPEVDGYQLLKQVRALGQAKGGRLPAIALTAFARTEDRTHALHAEFLAHLAKPVDPAELIATVAVAGRTGTSPAVNHHSVPQV